MAEEVEKDAKAPNERFLDADKESDDFLSAIRGYEKAQLVSLENAVKPIAGLINLLSADVWVAITKCANPKDGLTPDESASIYLYTMESIYVLLNQALRDKRRERLALWFPYLKLLLTALWKLPSIKCVVWRGVKLDISHQFQEGNKFFWWGLSSCTKSLNVLQSEQFLGETGPRTLFNIECIDGKSISNHSYLPEENEVLLLPCSYFEVMGKINTGSGLHTIHLKQIEPPVIFIPPPSNTLSCADEIFESESSNVVQRNEDILQVENTAMTLDFTSLEYDPLFSVEIYPKCDFVCGSEVHLFYNNKQYQCLVLLNKQGEQCATVKHNLEISDLCWSSFLNCFLIMDSACHQLYSFDVKNSSKIKKMFDFENPMVRFTCYLDKILVWANKNGTTIEQYSLSNWKLMKKFTSPLSCERHQAIAGIQFSTNGINLGVLVGTCDQYKLFRRFHLRDQNMNILRIINLGPYLSNLIAVPSGEFIVYFLNGPKTDQFLLISSDGKTESTIENKTTLSLGVHNISFIGDDYLTTYQCGKIHFYDLKPDITGTKQLRNRERKCGGWETIDTIS